MTSSREPITLPQLQVKLTRQAFGPGRGRGEATLAALRTARPSLAATTPSSGRIRRRDGEGALFLALRPVDGQPGWYKGRLPADRPGRYRTRLASSSSETDEH